MITTQGNGGPSSSSWRGDHSLNTTSRAVELACTALAEKAVPHLALCFAALFGESPAAAAAAVAAVSEGGKAPGRAVKLRGRLLGALEVRVDAWVGGWVGGGWCGRLGLEDLLEAVCWLRGFWRYFCCVFFAPVSSLFRRVYSLASPPWVVRGVCVHSRTVRFR